MMRCLLIASILLAITNVHAQPYMLVLGTAQDGGYPHIGCEKSCCTQAWKKDKKINVVSLALVDPYAKQWWLFEATPDIKEQLQLFHELTDGAYSYLPQGIFITHAHIGHYTGLMQLGREALGAKNVSVYALPEMKKYLEQNGPWNQLVALKNIDIKPLNTKHIIGLSKHITIQCFTVPHRDEYSETAGYKILTSGKNYLFIPDINKWSKWERNIIDEVSAVDVALLDATFYNENELPGRRMSEVPHPFVKETIALFNTTSANVREKVYFIHMNHTNPILWDTEIQNEVVISGYNYTIQGEKL